MDFGFVAEAGEVLGNPFNYRDSRTDGMMELAFSRSAQRERSSRPPAFSSCSSTACISSWR